MPFRPKNTRFWHYDFQIRGSRFHGSCGTEDFEEAKAVEAQARVAAKASPQRRGIFTLSEAIGTYIQDRCTGQPSARTSISQGKNILALMNPKATLDQITMADVQKFVRRRRAEVKNATVNRQIEFLDRAIKHMRKVHGAEVAELDLLTLKTKEAPERVRELTQDEQTRLFSHLRADLHPLVKMALMTGLRKAELCNLKWSHVDLHAGNMSIVAKGEITLSYPISREMRAFLSSLPRCNSLPHSQYVLTYLNQRTREPQRQHIGANGGGVWEDWKKALTEAGIEDFRFHDLRHTFATRMLRQTGNLKLVSRLLGHTTVETTMRYAHVLNDDLLDALNDYSLNSQSRSLSRRSNASD